MHAFQRPLILATLMLAFATVTAQAAVIEKVATANLQLGDDISEGLDQTTVFLDRFDPALGTLQAVTLRLDSSLSAGATFFFASGSSFTYTPRNYVVAEFSALADPPTLTVDTVLPQQNFTGVIWEPTASDDSFSELQPPPSELADYVGNTPFQALLTIEDRGSYVAANPLSFINHKYVISDVTLTASYQYQPVAGVPLPGAVWLFAGGLLGLLRIGRRTASA
ncbi:MAG: choice-of-anchor E domain-containing protein [Gammaproteobacteria bacterium]|nr:MAG: choice-of-anchor E domain-containing protein [Gammaproteobacteria bacterium]